MKRSILLLFTVLMCSVLSYAQTSGVASRMNEVFQVTKLASGPTRLYNPWEITYGPDDFLWITEARPYRVYRMDPNTGAKTEILDLSNESSTWTDFKRTFNTNASTWPQGGLAGLAIHPDFMNPVTPKKYVYISYVKTNNGGSSPTGRFFTTWLVRFTYNTGTNKLESPVALCDTLPGSNDHNSQRLIITPVNGINYLFYAIGDMGAGQFDNLSRVNYAQDSSKYQGKILRFNLEEDLDPGTLDKWIPNDNPFNTTSPDKQNAVWVTGIRNNQGFAYDSVRNILYGSSHGPFSDDEVNIIERGKNYGHPRVIGYAADRNYDSAKAGPASSSLPFIYNEAKYASDTIGTRYGDPIYSFYPSPKGNVQTPGSVLWSVQYIYQNRTYDPPGPDGPYVAQNANGFWFSEGTSGLGLYNYSVIPGWKNSLLAANLKGGKVSRLKLASDGLSVLKTAPYDTINVFPSANRFRDLAISPDGASIFVTIDSSETTSGPTTSNPVISACRGCVVKYTFLGYNSNGTTSSLPNHIEIGPGKSDACENMNTVNISAANNNNNLWVPITDTLGNIIAEIKANNKDLGNITTSVYIKSGAVREFGFYKTLYANRSITIKPQNTFTGSVNVRLYLTNAEYDALRLGTNSLGQASGITAITNVGVFKNNETPCSYAMDLIPTAVTIVGTPYTRNPSTGYVIEVSVTGFSTFYFARAASALPLRLLSFKGALSDDAAKLQWLTENDNGTRSYIVERSINGKDFDSVGTIASKNAADKFTYYFSDADVRKLSAPVVYYRLKMTDINSQYSYSEVVKLNLGLIAGTITVRPNPVVTEATIDVYSTIAEKASWTLTDMNGKTVMQRSLNLRKGNNSLNINLSSLPTGMYYLKVSGNAINQAIKLQKL